MTVSDVVAMAVDPLRGYIFLATEDEVQRYGFTVDLGVDMMAPSITMKPTPTLMYVGQDILSLTVDADTSVLYVGSDDSITIV
jgi:hypothetical protein